MNKTIIFLIVFAGLIAYQVNGQQDALKIVPPNLLPELLALNNDLETVQRPKYLTPVDLAVSPDKKTIYIAEQTAKQIAKYDVATSSVTAAWLMPNEPTGVAVSKDGTTLYVTCASEKWPNGNVCVVSTATGKVSKRIPVGHMARAPVISPDGSTLYVCNWFSNDISIISLASNTETNRIHVTREPYAAAITPDGATLVVTNSLPDQKATDTVAIACKIALINTATKTVRASIPLPVGSHSLFGVCVTPDGKYALATHLVGRFTIPSVTLQQGWVHSNNMAVVDIIKGSLTNDIMLDYANAGFSNPWGIRCTGDGKYVCVLHAGSDDMSIIDLPQLITKALSGKDLSQDFNSTSSIKSVIPMNIRSPRMMAMVDNKAYVAAHFSDTMNLVSIFSLSNIITTRSMLGPVKPLNKERLGESNYCDARLCMQKWQSCFSCHPFTRPDALNWILNNPVSSTPKNAKSMLHTWWTPPTSWAGKRTHAGGIQGSIRAGISAELFIEPSEELAVPLDTFIMRLKPVPSPHLVKGRFSVSALRGKTAFKKANCNYCHPGPLYTDLQFHNAGIVDIYDATTNWDTPSLIEAWRTEPYGHLGSYDILKEIVVLPGHSLEASTLTQQELQDLLEFVLSL